MIATIGEALDLGWKLRIFCRFGKRDAMKSIRECKAHVEIDLATLVWTRGRHFPVARLDAHEVPTLRVTAGSGSMDTRGIVFKQGRSAIDPMRTS